MANELRPVEIINVAVYDGKKGWFHCFGERSYLSKKGGVMHEIVGVVELEDGKVLQLSIGRFKFLDRYKSDVTSKLVDTMSTYVGNLAEQQ